MATIAAYPGWYKGDDTLLRHDVTEVAIVSEYTAPKNTPSWNASTDENDPIPAYLIGTKLILVCNGLTEIPDLMFNRFVSLKRAEGFKSVTSVGNWAFYCTPALEYIDLDPSKLKSIGNDAFRLSSAEDSVDLSNVASSITGERATRSSRWSAAALEAIRAVDFPKHVYLDVPNADSQLNYKHVDYATKDGETISVADGGCPTLTAYHAWNCLHAGTNKVYTDFLTWFNAKLNVDTDGDGIGDYAANTDKDSGYRARDYETLGWVQTDSKYIENENQLKDIIERLSYGFPVDITIRANTANGYHSVLIIGCDPATRKLAIVDSGAHVDYGVVYWISYEDICTESNEGAGDCEVIRYVNYKPPILAAGNAWFSQGNHGIAKSSITEIEIVREVPAEFQYDKCWDASATGDGKVMAYVKGSKLTIAGNGYRFIWGNSDSRYMFSGTTITDFFDHLTRIDGAELLHMRNVKTILGLLSGCKALTYINLEEWDMANCEAMNSAFQFLCSYKHLDFSKWRAPKVTTLRMAFQGNSGIGIPALVSIKGLGGIGTDGLLEDISLMCYNCENLEEVDIKGLNVANVTKSDGMYRAFYGCSSLESLDFTGWDNTNAASSAEVLNGTCLQKVTTCKTFKAKGFSLPDPSASITPCADGNWYDEDRNPYPTAQLMQGDERTYYSSEYWLEGLDQDDVLVKNGFLKQLAMAARYKTGTTDKMKPAEALKVLALDLAT